MTWLRDTRTLRTYEDTQMNQKAASVDLRALVDQIQTRGDLAAFLESLEHDLRDNPESWENRDLSSFLQAAAAWVGDMEGFYENQGEKLPAQPSWKMLGQIFLAARVYE
jgi:hypothetical protein